MRLVPLGVSGSFPGPATPASSYLVRVTAAEAAAAGYQPRDWNLLLDLGNGAFGALQRHMDPMALDAVSISHLHPDHCADLSGLYVYLRYHPRHGSLRTGRRPKRLPVYGPADAARHLAHSSGLSAGETMENDFDFQSWAEHKLVEVGPLTIEPHRVFHPVETYGVRVTGPSSSGGTATLAYTGDTDACSSVVELARDADLLLSEAAFLEGRDDVVERGIHLTGRRAGQVATDAGARRLLLTHLPVWNDPADSLAEARGSYAGPVDVAQPGTVYDL
ncbi:ribonuclease BN (tRNA processing enzyme) [Promicromonospora sp. AC04]|uniref:MBL fold metallo-hydrolase n=1 Tax=Promicromonospora sp. AC04 TaxID=2135723 RepID=UPI000D376232|nr:MBL fold metallo-hydrolase [Promicromonospora sp. AC04]PUB32239.1 ribonuclease BN (tRNA processing enzyme) [Promicromonospora sp. AC04]